MLCSVPSCDLRRGKRSVRAAAPSMAAWFGASLLLDWLTPVDFDGAAHVSLKESDARLKLEALLAWELKNLLELLDVISRRLLLPLQGLLAQSVARDKLARLTQYALLMINGLVVALGGPASASARLRAVMKPLGDARQTGRWLNGVAPLLALRGELAACASAPPFGAAPAIASKLALIGYFLLDHVVWLQKARVLGGDASRTSRRSLRLLAAVHACSLLQLGMRVARQNQPEVRTQLAAVVRGEARPSCSQELRLAARALLRELMLLVQAAHNAHLLRTHDSLVGFLGVCTGLDDVTKLWRKARECVGP